MKLLVTGAAGSIGSELCRQLSKKHTVVAVDQDESGVFDLALEDKNIIPEIGNVRNRERLAELFEKYRPTKVFHAAAYKHLSFYEREHLEEIILTNVLGTLNVIKLCEKYKAKLIFISTDKAVNPTSLMGCTKLLGEIMVRRCNGVVVRFGNVLGSRGSVLTIWEKQKKAGKPLTITDERMTRYFMTIQDAVKLVIEASNLNKRYGTLILDMGEQKNIAKVAEEIYGTYPKIITGIKEGEKLAEELFTLEENSRKRKIGKFFAL